MTHRRALPTRRQLLAGAAAAPLAALATTALGPAPATGAGSRRPPTRPVLGPPVRGADIGFTLQLEEIGATWRHRGGPQPIERILRQAGANWVRLRVWTDPPSGYSTIDSALTLARRAERAGLKVLLNLHYSDFWADPSKQFTPAAWEGQDLAQLTETVHAYTKDAVERFARAGAPVDMVQVGNEIIGGMLWPLGRIYPEGAPENFDDFCTLLRSGLAGVLDADAPTPRTMVHIDRGGELEATRYFFDRVLARDVEFDVIGQSYYPFWHGSLAELEENLVDSAERYGKDLVVVETSYPWTLGNGDELENLIVDPEQLPDLETWPPTPQGQFDYFDALRGVFGRVPGGHGLGFMAWEPGWLPGVGWTPGEGNPNDNLTLFDWEGKALPALAAYRAGPMR